MKLSAISTIASIATIAIALAFAAPARAQNYQFTISGGAAGNGLFSNGSTNPQLTFIPITNLSGLLNGNSMALVPISNQVGNMFNLNTMGIVPFYPMFFTAGGSEWTISHEDQEASVLLNNITTHTSTAINFIVKPFSPVTSQLNAAQSQQTKLAPRNHNLNLTLSISIPVAVAIVVSVYELHKHHHSEYSGHKGVL